LIRYFRAHAKAQVASLDIVLSVIALLLFVGLVIAIAPSLGGSAEARTIYGGLLFENIEDLKKTDDTMAFLSDYKVDEVKLTAFAAELNDDIENIIFTNSDEYSSSNCDFCMFFENNTANAPIVGNPTLGETYQDAAHSSTGACLLGSPCEHYPQSHVFLKPVLRKGSIMNLYIVVCKE